MDIPAGAEVLLGVPLESGELRERLLGLAESLSGPETPYRPQFEYGLERDGHYDVLIAIESAPKSISAERLVSIEADDWTGYVNCVAEHLPAHDIKLPFGSYTAACLGVGEVFKHLLASNYPAQLGNRVRFLDKGCLSLLDFSTTPAPSLTTTVPETIDIGNVLVLSQLGLGRYLRT